MNTTDQLIKDHMSMTAALIEQIGSLIQKVEALENSSTQVEWMTAKDAVIQLKVLCGSWRMTAPRHLTDFWLNRSQVLPLDNYHVRKPGKAYEFHVERCAQLINRWKEMRENVA